MDNLIVNLMFVSIVNKKLVNANKNRPIFPKEFVSIYFSLGFMDTRRIFCCDFHPRGFLTCQKSKVRKKGHQIKYVKRTNNMTTEEGETEGCRIKK